MGRLPNVRTIAFGEAVADRGQGHIGLLGLCGDAVIYARDWDAEQSCSARKASSAPAIRRKTNPARKGASFTTLASRA